jgi:RNA polymerase sigma factor (sigma-70 family)
MASNRANMEIADILQVVRAHHTKDHSDGQLLAQFLGSRDEAAFATLVRRHGPMVLGVCGRILANAADVEDAFQATFLVLVHKASSLRSRPVLGDWLHGVARRTALNAKRVAARRRAKEKAMARTEVQGEPARNDWLPLLDEELSRLPEKYRLPIVLCDLEERTRGEAALRLGWPEGTVAGRLARGRSLLARKLARRGVAMPAGAYAALSLPNAAPASVPAALTSSTIRAAMLVAAGQAATVGAIPAHIAALVEGVLKTMLLTKVKTATAVIFVTAVLGAGLTTGILIFETQAGQPAPAPQTGAAPNAKEVNEVADQKKQAGPTAEPIASELIFPEHMLSIRVTHTLPDAPIDGIFQVEASGKVALGPPYGRVNVRGLTLEEAEAAVQKQLERVLKNPQVSVTLPIPGTERANEDLGRRIRQLEREVSELKAVVQSRQTKQRQ